MKLNPERFKFTFAFQTVLLLIDLSINTFSMSFKKHNSVLLVCFIVQDLSLILGLALLLLSFFSTYVFQIGHVEVLYDKFRSTICVCVFYFFLTTVLYIAILCIIDKDSDKFWSNWFLMIFLFQRLALYYYFYKRAALLITDPGFYSELKYFQ